GGRRIISTSKEIFDKGFKHTSNFESPRTKAFTILGLCHYYKTFGHDKNLSKNVLSLANQLVEGYQHFSSADWCWFEPYLTYANGRLAQALFSAYDVVANDKYLQIARKSLDFLVKHQIIDDRFVPIGNRGWYNRDGHRALYDQQPIEASCMVEAALTGFRATKEKRYQKLAHTAFDWFLGKNSKNVMVYDPKTGACYDGITPHGLNLNRGAEATISYLLASLELENLGE
ncbi:MAG: glycosyl transferase family 1, partial [Candidatus Bathyarchaeota archaeon]